MPVSHLVPLWGGQGETWHNLRAPACIPNILGSQRKNIFLEVGRGTTLADLLIFTSFTPIRDCPQCSEETCSEQGIISQVWRGSLAHWAEGKAEGSPEGQLGAHLLPQPHISTPSLQARGVGAGKGWAELLAPSQPEPAFPLDPRLPLTVPISARPTWNH